MSECPQRERHEAASILRLGYGDTLKSQAGAVRPDRVESMLMRVASGRVIDGHVELVDAELPEGSTVTVLLSEGDETFEADEETERMLLESIAQCDRGETVPFESVLERLRRRG